QDGAGQASGGAGLFPPPTLGERCHRSFARRLIAVGRMVAPTARGNGSALHGRDGTRAAQQQEEPSRSCRDAEFTRPRRDAILLCSVEHFPYTVRCRWHINVVQFNTTVESV